MNIKATVTDSEPSDDEVTPVRSNKEIPSVKTGDLAKAKSLRKDLVRPPKDHTPMRKEEYSS